MAAMKLHLYIGVMLCLAMRNKGQTSDVFKSVVEPVVELCKAEVPDYTEEDLNSVLNLEEPFSEAAMCLLNCGMTKLNMIQDGKVAPPEDYLVTYEKAYADKPERLADAEEVVSTCYDEVSSEVFENPCEVGLAMIRCTARLVNGEE